MIILIAIAALVILLILTIIYAFIHYGTLDDIDVKAGPPPFNLNNKMVAYKLNRGPYRESGHLFTEITGDLVRINPGISSKINMIGFYYDNDIEDEQQCRYAVGVILPDVSPGAPVSTESRAPDDTLVVTQEVQYQLKTGLEAIGYKVATLPTVDHVVHATFPFRGAFSIVIATRKVYPCLNWYVQEHNLCAHPSIEVYTSDSIHFILPLSKQDSFYFFPPESESASEDESVTTEIDETNISNSEADHEEGSSKQGTSSSPSVERKQSSEGSSSFEEVELPLSPKKN